MSDTATRWRKPATLFSLGLLVILLPAALFIAHARRQAKTALAPRPIVLQGAMDLDTPALSLRLVRSSQTVAPQKPKAAADFDFTPGDRVVERSKDGYYHLGDLDLRLREGSAGQWKGYSTALFRQPVTALPASGLVLAASDLTPTLAPDLPLQITRTWGIEGRNLVLRFTLKNKVKQSVQVGALGIPMIFNNTQSDRSLEQAHAICSFYDPYIGQDAGYLQVTRLNGHGPALLVLPVGKTPFEAYNPILDEHRPGTPPIFHDPTPRGITFEGFYEWMVHSAAYADNEWKNTQPWNVATSITLKPGESRTY